MNPDRQAEVEAIRRNCRTHLIDYARSSDPGYMPGRFHHFLAEKLQRVAEGKSRRLIVSVPPRHGKSRLISVEFPTWLLGRKPFAKIMLASYAASLSSTHAKEARARMLDAPFRAFFPRVAVDPRDRAAEDWRTVQGGRYLATSVGGSMTGHGADLLIVDDPHKDFEEAHSETQREKVWNWFTSTALTRLGPGGAAIVIMTRWHPDDLVGRLTDPKKTIEAREILGPRWEPWEVVNLPAIAEENDPLGRPVGEALHPARYPADELRLIQATVGSYTWNALYRGAPEVKGGNYIPTDNFVIVDKSPLPDGALRGRYWDLATSENALADYTAGARGGFLHQGQKGKETLVIEDLPFGQWRWPLARGKIVALAEAERILVGVEAVGGFKTSFDNLMEVFPSDVKVIETGADSDKLMRALPWIALTEAKRVILVRGPWLDWFLRQCREFPKGKHDDGIDAVSGLYSILRTRRPMLA